jgi:transposase
VDLYGLVRRMVMRDGLSHREAARRFGIDRGTVAKMVKHPVPPGYQRTIPVHRPKLSEHVEFIEQVLDADEAAPAKQRHTARRIFERLRDERGFDGSYSTVRDYVRSRRQVRKEVFVPLAHPPGHAQADFGEAVVKGTAAKTRSPQPDREMRFLRGRVVEGMGLTSNLLLWMPPSFARNF